MITKEQRQVIQALVDAWYPSYRINDDVNYTQMYNVLTEFGITLPKKYKAETDAIQARNDKLKNAVECYRWVMKATGLNHNYVQFNPYHSTSMKFLCVAYQTTHEHFEKHLEPIKDKVKKADLPKEVYVITTPHGDIEYTYEYEEMYEGCTS